MDESEPGMAQPSNRGQFSGPWRPATSWTDADRAGAPWEWLTHSGSLTRKLRNRTGAAFNVQVLKEAGIGLAAEDARLLGVAPGSAARLREVYLCGAVPLVFGRTLASGEDAAHWLQQLGARPLGDRVFAEADTTRGEIEVTQVSTADALYHDAVRGLPAAPATLWARRSVLSVQAARLLIYECFLPGVAG